MASWVSPGCLGTEAHFTKTFHDPIMDGMAADCSPLQAEKQEQVSNSMHSILSKKIHRRDADVLARDLPFLQETIIHVRCVKEKLVLQSVASNYLFLPRMNFSLFLLDQVVEFAHTISVLFPLTPKPIQGANEAL
jgi:hypothetical protein